jgi:serine carboxypeptidase-like clade 2
MLHYSGDTDGAVTTYGTKRWIKNLNWAKKHNWRPWYTTFATEGKQVSGYVEEYDGLTFATVKGVGHMAPQWARQPMQEFVTAFMHGEPY